MPTLPPSYGDGSGNWSGQYQTLRLSWLKLEFLDYFFTPKTPSFAALATRNLTTVLAGILIFCCVFGLKPVRAFLFCFTSLPKPGKTNSPFFLILPRFFCRSGWLRQVHFGVRSWPFCSRGLCQKPVHPSSLETQKNPVANPPLFPPPPFREFMLFQ